MEQIVVSAISEDIAFKFIVNSGVLDEYFNKRCPSENCHIYDFVDVSETIWFSYGFNIQSNTNE